MAAGALLDLIQRFRVSIAYPAAMHSQSACILGLDLTHIGIERELNRSETSTIYEIRLYGETYVMKLVSAVFGAPLDEDDADVSVP